MRRLLTAGNATLSTAIIAGFCLAASSIAAAAPKASPGDTPSPFEFRRLLVETNGDAPEACFRFSQSLRPQAEAHYGDYVEVEPETPLAIRTSDKDLCLGGLAYGTQYTVKLRRGLPALSGAAIEAEQAVEVSLGDRAPLVSIAGQGFILPRTTSNGLAIQTINVDSVKVRVLRMSDRLLPAQLGRGDRSFIGSDGGAL